MRTTPAAREEADVWLTVMVRHGHLHHVESGADGTWSVQRTPDSVPWTLHHPVFVLDYVAEILRDVRRPRGEGHR
ncbi:hypothetical protein GCM10027160_17180 [Streptomyces calidiresistens]|uniref:Uncharacterized protein n=1 Tax=Streptomyces calidiresistens TaxID=1485586 RepID=A0A7W3XUR9_9ACTN|nr:hypothetical protein [Streptomyces calidiresistens]MBB0228215.1 hypothetical protein [Streptomyces calidiresistens]